MFSDAVNEREFTLWLMDSLLVWEVEFCGEDCVLDTSGLGFWRELNSLVFKGTLLLSCFAVFPLEIEDLVKLLRTDTDSLLSEMVLLLDEVVVVVVIKEDVDMMFVIVVVVTVAVVVELFDPGDVTNDAFGLLLAVVVPFS